MAKTKTVDGKALSPEDFAYVGDAEDVSTWHLPIDKEHVQSALEMFGREEHVPAGKKTAVARKIAAAAKKAGLDTKGFEAKHLSSEHADFDGGWVEIFRAGNYGPKGEFSQNDLDTIIRNYNPSVHEAPACIGHPADDKPAYGWADRLMRSGDLLLAKFKEVDPAFETAIREGRYKKRSAAFYLDDRGRASGLRHVAFLGAQPPEVKGLRNIHFQDDNGRIFTTVEFGEEEAVAEDKTLKEQIKAVFAEWFGSRENVSATFSEAQVKQFAEQAAVAAAVPLQTKVTELETALTAQSTAFAESQRKIAGGETAQRAAAAVAYLKEKGAWVPAFKEMGLETIFGEMAKQTITIEFGEGDKKKTLTPLELLTQFLEGLPKVVPVGRVFNGTAASGAAPAAGKDPLSEMAYAVVKEDKVTFGEALARVAAEHPELTVAGGAQAGSV